MSRLPPAPPERDQTPRARIASVLREELVTARELSQRVGVSEKDVTLHLEHLARSALRAGERMVVAPAGCLGCGFAFDDRERFSKPGRCPRCRGHRSRPHASPSTRPPERPRRVARTAASDQGLSQPGRGGPRQDTSTRRASSDRARVSGSLKNWGGQPILLMFWGDREGRQGSPPRFRSPCTPPASLRTRHALWPQSRQVHVREPRGLRAP
jgi:predicted Zn-ribbon and HTH transcriptional regulator